MNRKILSLLLIVLIAGLGVGGVFLMKLLRNKAKEEPSVVLVPKVQVVQPKKQNFTVYLHASGKVNSAQRATLSAEVTGKAVRVSEKLQVGEIIEKDAFLVEIDSEDYKTALAQAESVVADAKLALQQEEAKAEQNLKEWKRLGKGEPSDLVARVPYLESARARLKSAQAAEKKAKRDIEKTIIKAPYRLRVEKKFIEQGDFVAMGARLLEGHAADRFEVRLPVKLSEYVLIKDESALIDLTAPVKGSTLQWKAQFTRDEGMVDQATLSMPVIATVLPNKNGKYGGNYRFPPVGLFVKARIKAQEMKSVLVLPREAVRLGGRVFLVDADGKLRIKKVTVIHTDKVNAVVDGISEKDQVIVSPVEAAIDGMDVDTTGNEK